MIATVSIHQYTTAEDLLNTGVALCQTANEAGIFLQDESLRDKVTLKRVRCEMKDWLKTVRKEIAGMSPGTALQMLSTYDMIHRAVYGIPADPDFLNKYTMAAFESRIRGNKEVDPYVLYRRVNAGLARRDPLYFGGPLQWSTTILDRWYKDLTTYTPSSHTSPSGTPKVSSSGSPASSSSDSQVFSFYDLLSKATILMETDLWVYEGANQKAFKRQLFDTLRLSLHGVTDSIPKAEGDPSVTLDASTRKALKTFLSSSRRYLPKETFDIYSN